MDYCRLLTDDKAYADRWFLGEPVTDEGIEVDAREFCYGRPYSGPRPAVVPIRQSGRSVAFHLAAFNMPVVSSEIADVLEHSAPADIQRFPVTIGSGIRGFEILNVVGTERCVDEVRSKARKWGPDDGRPDKVGQYRQITRLIIDPRRTMGRHLLRIWGSLVELIVSEKVMESLSSVPDLGIVFEKVT